MTAASRITSLAFATLFVAAGAAYGQGCNLTGPAAQTARAGNLDEALAAYEKEIAADPTAAAPSCAAGIVLDLMGKTSDSKKYFTKAISLSTTPQAKANAQRAM